MTAGRECSTSPCTEPRIVMLESGGALDSGPATLSGTCAWVSSPRTQLMKLGRLADVIGLPVGICSAVVVRFVLPVLNGIVLSAVPEAQLTMQVYRLREVVGVVPVYVSVRDFS